MMSVFSWGNSKTIYTSSLYAGDYESAVDTLKMAVSLIKQSITASSDASQVREYTNVWH